MIGYYVSTLITDVDTVPVEMEVYEENNGYTYTETIDNVKAGTTASRYIKDCNNNMDITPWDCLNDNQWAIIKIGKSKKLV